MFQETSASVNQALLPNPFPFMELERLDFVHEYVQAFYRATGLSLRLVPVSRDPYYAPPEQSAASCITVPVIISNQQVATLLTVPTFTDGSAKADCDVSQPAKESEYCDSRGVRAITPNHVEGVKRLMELFARSLEYLVGQNHFSLREDQPLAVVRAREYIVHHIHEPLHTAEIARYVNLCADHCARLFHHVTGLTLGRYITRVRFQRALELLADAHLRITEVAFASGFQSIPTFNRTFKRLTGQSPRNWRITSRTMRRNATKSDIDK